jgi:hypothetical protein
MKPPAPVTNAQGFGAFDILTAPSPKFGFGVHTGHVTADTGVLKCQEGVVRLLRARRYGDSCGLVQQVSVFSPGGEVYSPRLIWDPRE